MMHFAFGVDSILLTRVLKMIISAIRVLQLPGWFILSPPAVSLMCSFSSLFGLKLQLKLPYVMSFILSFGTWYLWINLMVLVPFTLLSLSPWANHPNSFAADLVHDSLYFWVTEELAVGQVHVCLFVVCELGSFDALYVSVQVHVLLWYSCHCLCFEMFSNPVFCFNSGWILFIQYVHGVGCGGSCFVHPWSWYVCNWFVNCGCSDWGGFCTLGWVVHPWTWCCFVWFWLLWRLCCLVKGHASWFWCWDLSLYWGCHRCVV